MGGASLAEIDASLLGDNGQAQLLTLPYSETHLRSTHLLCNTAPGWVDQGGRVYSTETRRRRAGRVPPGRRSEEPKP